MSVKPSIFKPPLVFLLVGAVVFMGLALYIALKDGDHPMAVTEGTFEQEVLRSELPVLVDFWAVWCGPCRMVAPTVEKFAGEFKGKVKVVKVDVDQNPGLSRAYRINGIPTLLVFHKGTIVKSWTGALPEEAFRKELQIVYDSLL